MTPTVGNYPLCNTYVGVAGTGERVVVWCEPSPLEGRYVIVQIPGSWEAITVCEVEVYGCKYTNNVVKGYTRKYYIDNNGSHNKRA